MPFSKFSTLRSLLNLLLVSSTIASALSAQTPAPSDIYVGRGYFGGEYYDFFTDQARTNQVNISDYIFYRGSTYTFHKILGSGHPFYLSDTPLSSGSYHRGTLTLPVTSSANPNRTSGSHTHNPNTYFPIKKCSVVVSEPHKTSIHTKRSCSVEGGDRRANAASSAGDIGAAPCCRAC